jgi:predicted TIM-barrel fold metal-dependent hydrolase
MHRRNFLKATSLSLALGNSSLLQPQGREFRPAPPPAPPTSRRIIDTHVHIFFQNDKPSRAEFMPHTPNSARPDGDYQINPSWDQFRYDMGAVDRAVILHVAKTDLGRKGNDDIAAVAKRWPEKLVPFGSVHPMFAGAIEEFTRSIKELGFKGCKLSPIYQKFHPMDPAVCKIYAKAEEWGVPLIFHTATAQAPDIPLRYANPILFDDVANAFPDLKIIMAHLGHPWQRECIVMARKHRNVYMELSANFYRPWSLYNALLLAMEWGQSEKIFFGTDWPYTTARETMAGLRGLNQFAKGGNPRIPDEVIEGIIYRDALAILGIKT